MTLAQGQFGLDMLRTEVEPPRLAPIGDEGVESAALSALDLLNTYTHVFVAAFLVTLLATPIVRRIAVAAGVVDRPDARRKRHQYPVAYLGGVAVFLGLIVALGISYFTADESSRGYLPVPLAIVIGMVAIMFTGFADDVWGWDPRLKIAGQLVAAAALAINDIGTRVAEGLFAPFMGRPDVVLFTILDFHVLNGHVFYWVGTALIAVFVLGGCNAANLIDGLDGLLSGVMAIVAIGLLAICLLIAPGDFRSFEVSQAEATEAAAATEIAVEKHLAREGSLPATLDALSGPQPELPVGWGMSFDPVTGAVAPIDDRAAYAQAEAIAIHTEVRLYRDRVGEYPRQLMTLVEEGSLESIPAMPAGRVLRYDPNSGLVAVEGGGASLAGARIVLCLALLGAALGFLPHNFNPATIFLGDCGSLLLGYMAVVIILMLGHRGQTYFVFAGLIVYSVPIIDTTLAIIRRRLAGTSLSAADDQHLHHQLKRSLGGVRRAVVALYAIGSLFAIVGVSLVVLVLNGLRVRVIYAIALVLFGSIAVLAVKEARRQKYRLADEPAPTKRPGPQVASSAPRSALPPAPPGPTPAPESEAPGEPTSSTR